MRTRPKTFVAVTNFSCAGQRFRAGDVVPPSVALSAALRFGDRFVTVARTNTRTRPPAVPVVAADLTDQPTDGDVDKQPQE